MRGTLIDSFTILVMALVISITVITVFFFVSEVGDSLNATDIGINMTYFERGETALMVFNQGFAIVVFGWMIASILLAFTIRSTPAFLVVSILLFIILIFISPTVSNVFDQFATTSVIVNTANQFDLIVLMMQNLPLIMLVAGIVLSIAIHAKVRGSQDVV